MEEEIQDWTVETEVVEEIQDWQVDVEEPEIAPVELEPEIETIEAKVEQIAEDVQVELETQTSASEKKDWTSTQRDIAFQVLYFDVNSVTFAVPLDELGGIHQLTQLNHLIGRPGWYLVCKPIGISNWMWLIRHVGSCQTNWLMKNTSRTINILSC